MAEIDGRPSQHGDRHDVDLGADAEAHAAKHRQPDKKPGSRRQSGEQRKRLRRYRQQPRPDLEAEGQDQRRRDRGHCRGSQRQQPRGVALASDPLRHQRRDDAGRARRHQTDRAKSSGCIAGSRHRQLDIQRVTDDRAAAEQHDSRIRPGMAGHRQQFRGAPPAPSHPKRCDRDTGCRNRAGKSVGVAAGDIQQGIDDNASGPDQHRRQYRIAKASGAIPQSEEGQQQRAETDNSVAQQRLQLGHDGGTGTAGRGGACLQRLAQQAENLRKH
jgi:hypothetical protein